MTTTRYRLTSILVIVLCLLCEARVVGQDQATNQATIQISQTKKNPPAIDDPPGSEPDSAPLKPELRIKAIEKRIDIIKEIMAKKQAKSETEKANGKTAETDRVPSSDTATEPPKSQSNENPPLPPTENHPPESEPEKSPALSHESSSEHIGKVPSKLGEKELEDFQISTSPMNSFELANSLFVTGHYGQALKGYEALLVDDTPALEQDWLRCLAAHCYRIKGEVSTAEKLYREVVASKEKSFPSDHAKWYLNHLSRRKKIEADLELLEAELQPFQPQPAETKPIEKK